MTRDPVTVNLDSSLVSCLDIMFEKGCRHLPVLSEGRLFAVLSCRDVPPLYWMMRYNWFAAQGELKEAISRTLRAVPSSAAERTS